MLMLCVAVGVVVGGTAETRTVEADGEAPMLDGNKRAALDEAKTKALVSAVEQVAGGYVRSETELKDGAVVHDAVAFHARGHVKQFDFKEIAAGPELVKVHVTAEVLIEPLHEEILGLESLLGRLEGLKLRLTIEEQEGGPVIERLFPALSKDGWFVTRDQAVTDFTLYGTVRYFNQGTDFGAEGELALVHNPSRAQVTKFAVAVKPSHAANVASLADELTPQILSAVRLGLVDYFRSLKGGIDVQLQLAGATFEDVGPLTTALKKLPKVENVEEQDFDNGTQRYRVTFRGTVDELSALLAKTKAGKRAIKITGTGPLMLRGGLK